MDSRRVRRYPARPLSHNVITFVAYHNGILTVVIE